MCICGHLPPSYVLQFRYDVSSSCSAQNSPSIPARSQLGSFLLVPKLNWAKLLNSSWISLVVDLWQWTPQITKIDLMHGQGELGDLSWASTMRRLLNVSLISFGFLLVVTNFLAVPYPYAIEEGFDLYCALAESSGRNIGMSGRKLDVILSGDSA